MQPVVLISLPALCAPHHLSCPPVVHFYHLLCIHTRLLWSSSPVIVGLISLCSSRFQSIPSLFLDPKAVLNPYIVLSLISLDFSMFCCYVFPKGGKKSNHSSCTSSTIPPFCSTTSSLLWSLFLGPELLEWEQCFHHSSLALLSLSCKHLINFFIIVHPEMFVIVRVKTDVTTGRTLSSIEYTEEFLYLNNKNVNTNVQTCTHKKKNNKKTVYSVIHLGSPNPRMWERRACSISECYILYIQYKIFRCFNTFVGKTWKRNVLYI